jgi:hypothetical protein
MRSTTLVVAASALILLLGTGSATAKTRVCKNTYGGDVISAKNVSCKKARAIVRAWAAGYKADGNPSREVRGWRCRGRNEPAEGLTIRCTRSGKRVRFYANVP